MAGYPLTFNNGDGAHARRVLHYCVATQCGWCLLHVDMKVIPWKYFSNVGGAL